MPPLLLAEHDNASLKDATNKALTAAKALGAEVHILVAGHNCKAVADAAAKLDGVSKVLLADAPAYEHMLAEPCLLYTSIGRVVFYQCGYHCDQHPHRRRIAGRTRQPGRTTGLERVSAGKGRTAEAAGDSSASAIAIGKKRLDSNILRAAVSDRPPVLRGHVRWQLEVRRIRSGRVEVEPPV